MTKEGYLEEVKNDDNYLIIIKKDEKWYSNIGSVNSDSYKDFENILKNYKNNFYNDFIGNFPNEKKNIQNNVESILKLFKDKSEDLIKDKNKVSKLINDNKKNISKLREKNKNYYKFNEDKYNFTNVSKELQTKIDLIKEEENKLDLNIITLNKSNSEDNKGKKFLIQNGIPIKNGKKDITKSTLEKKFDFGKSEVNNIEISEINITKIPKTITINSLIKFFDDCELGAIIFPLYIYKVIESKNKNKQEEINKFFSVLNNAYLSIKNDDNLISEYTYNFKKSYEYMLSVLIEAGYNPDSTMDKNFKQKQYTYNNIIFTLPEKGKFKVPNNNFTKKDLSKNKHKEKNQKKNNNNENNLNTKEIKNNKNSNLNSQKKEIIKKPKFIFNIPKPSIPQETTQIFGNISNKTKKSKKNIKSSGYNKNLEGFYKHEAKSDRAITGNEFLTNYFDINDELKIIINYMKIKNKKAFLYKTDKNLIFLDDVKEYLKENSKEEENEVELKFFINLSNPITKKLIKEISKENYYKDIKFNNLKINILFDCTRIIDIYHRYIYFILIIGLTNALSSLEINYTNNIKCRIK